MVQVQPSDCCQREGLPCLTLECAECVWASEFARLHALGDAVQSDGDDRGQHRDSVYGEYDSCQWFQRLDRPERYRFANGRNRDLQSDVGCGGEQFGIEHHDDECDAGRDVHADYNGDERFADSDSDGNSGCDG